ncbi:LysR substrate-binding domain-containing protein [Shinella yambaruensis]|uniref:LysR family transcriptional regulator n=1 Tax=Shinella yambaruensis TaxID=415996 RepID=A0ABQ5ZLD6_9HYPH|nr:MULTISPECIES: LysR substrate-binding domain-containing protein [Shinella]CAI0336542.1 DNA-binding transcriptional regulator, LysR family [Rhizobiaceae bacterium]CAK7255076.1 DNA-binding transcriptional regulator, LysR family [Shinella sp. WSC3-e]MCJ8026296.1 LysR substrate-binding domain-containing protein [Shinella yambaruensis]MCO5136433.1 LysR substrate-binding domain-containing protein [Shinella sp.]MCU7981703.1 LysR substrate-binding domain-containing protein [Shinella yambaruensis]
MNLRQVEVFRMVMTNGTTARAADVLHVSQPAVSKMIQELERSLGFDLFQRIKGRLQPTQEGQLFFREVEQAFLGLTHLRGAAARIRDYGSGELRIACLSALSTNVLPRALHAFMQSNPNVGITFQARMSSNVRDLVASGQFDLGIVADEIDRTGVEVEEFAQFRVALAMPQGHPLEALDVIHPSDLDGQKFIALAPEDTTRREAEAVFERAGVTVRPVIETPYSTTICAMVAAGIGIGLVNPLTAEPYVDHGLVLRPFEPALHFRTLLITPPNRLPSRNLEEFIKQLRGAI